MKFGFQQKLPEEIELEHKRDELASLCAQHQAAQAVLQKVRDEIGQFERRYDQTLGRRIAELERIEGEISRLTGGATEAGSPHQGAPSEDAERSFRAGRGEGKSAEQAGRGDTQDIKALYREVAKAIHPDLAGQGVGELERHELMSRANRAYAQLDHRTLQDILSKWKRSPGKVDGTDVAAELVRVIRQIARERQEIVAVNAKVRELKDSYVCRFKLKVEAQLAQGTDLFAEMVAAADLNIARALERLARLKGERRQGSVGATDALRREICFPVDHFCGTLYLRDRDSLNFSQWRKFGPAKGCLEVGADKAVRLDVKADAAVKLSQMQKIQPNDLQALYLYEIADDDLESIVHLTGLEELYLSGTRLTDAALRGIHRLSNLKRIYLYQTVITDHGLVHLARLPGLKGLTSSGNSITDEGLALFQKAIPGVKTVSFPWKFGR
jgi:hypothetical protein